MTQCTAPGSERCGIINGDRRIISYNFLITRPQILEVPRKGIAYKMTDGKQPHGKVQAHWTDMRERGMRKNWSLKPAYQVTLSSLGQGASNWAYADTAGLRKGRGLKTLWSCYTGCLFCSLSSRNTHRCKKWFSEVVVPWGWVNT